MGQVDSCEGPRGGCRHSGDARHSEVKSREIDSHGCPSQNSQKDAIATRKCSWMGATVLGKTAIVAGNIEPLRTEMASTFLIKLVRGKLMILLLRGQAPTLAQSRAEAFHMRIDGRAFFRELRGLQP